MKMHKKGEPGLLQSETFFKGLGELKCDLNKSDWELSPAVCLGMKIVREEKEKNQNKTDFIPEVKSSRNAEAMVLVQESPVNGRRLFWHLQHLRTQVGSLYLSTFPFILKLCLLCLCSVPYFELLWAVGLLLLPLSLISEDPAEGLPTECAQLLYAELKRAGKVVEKRDGYSRRRK